MATLRFNLHPAQQVIHQSDARFKVIAAGRRFGKTVYAVIKCITEALRETNDFGDPLYSDSEVVYIGVDKEQARRNAWHLFREYGNMVGEALGIPVIFHEKDAKITMPNGVRIRLLGMDNPDSARGMKLRYAVLDEYADMPEHAWSEIIRPALMDTRGGALFIGTPKGKNHFYKLYLEALKGEKPGWEAFNFQSDDNTTLNRDELKSVVSEYTNGSEDLHAQEIQGKFIAKSGRLFSSDQFIIEPDSERPKLGTVYIAVDLAGFEKEHGKRHAELKKLDETAIAIVQLLENGKWWVREIQHGRWDSRETALRIVKAAVENQAVTVGIEKGALANAVAPYLNDYQTQYGRWLNIVPVTHGNKHKYDRIQWALQGRLQKRQIILSKAKWNDHLIDQAVDFPSRLSHDDLLDALAYIDQIAEHAPWDDEWAHADDYEPLDAVSGY